MQLAGGGWTARHDEIKWALHRRMKMARLGSVCEVTNLFKTSLRQDAMDDLQQVPRRERQGMVPDFLFTLDDGERILGDVKTMTAGDKYIQAAENRRNWAVKLRQDRVMKECSTHAKQLDIKYNGTNINEVGPCETKLRNFGRVHGLIFGAYGEVSRDTQDIVEKMGEAQALRDWRVMGSRTPLEARAVLVETIINDLSLITLRSHARLLLDRIQLNLEGDFSDSQKRKDTTRDNWNYLRWSLFTKNGPKAFVATRPARAI